MIKPRHRRTLLLLVAGGLLCLALLVPSGAAFQYSSSTRFCMYTCHEMQVVAEQGWMRSAHYQNPAGVVAQCTDCHVPPEPLPMVWTKTRDGAKDVFVHLFGESDPQRMDWDALAASARSHIADSACQRCHENLTPQGAPIKQLVAHRENARAPTPKRCVECHLEAFHDGFRAHVAPVTTAAAAPAATGPSGAHLGSQGGGS